MLFVSRCLSTKPNDTQLFDYNLMTLSTKIWFLVISHPFIPSLLISGQQLFELEIISTLLHQIGIPPPTVAPWQEALYKDRQSNRSVSVF